MKPFCEKGLLFNCNSYLNFRQARGLKIRSFLIDSLREPLRDVSSKLNKQQLHQLSYLETLCLYPQFKSEVLDVKVTIAKKKRV